MTRDNVEDCEEALNTLFYERIFKIIAPESSNSSYLDEMNRKNAYEILCNIMLNQSCRKKMVEYNKIKDIFDSAAKMNLITSKTSADLRILEKLSLLVSLMAFFSDMHDTFLRLDLLRFVVKLTDEKFSSTIRSNAIMTIKLLTYNPKIFSQMLSSGIIDLIMNLCKRRNEEILVKEKVTNALVHFALSDLSIKMLLEKKVLGLFEYFGLTEEVGIN